MRVNEYSYNMRAGEELLVERLEAFGRIAGKLVVEPTRFTLSPPRAFEIARPGPSAEGGGHGC